MTTLIALIIFGGSFIGLIYLIAKKVSILANLPEQPTPEAIVKRPIKQNLLQKTDLIKQAVLHNGKMQIVMSKTTTKFKTIFANRIATVEDLEKVEKIHQEGDYWQKVEERKLPVKKRASQKPKIKIVQATNVEVKQVEPKPKTPRTRKKKPE